MIGCCSCEVTATIVSEMREANKNIQRFDAKSISAATEGQLEQKGTDQLKCVGQTYDGAAVMSGDIGGVQAQFQIQHPEATYVHCYAHELNLVLCHTCRAVSVATEFSNLLESLHSFFSVAFVHHHKFLDFQKKLGLQQSDNLCSCQTRLACQLRSVTAVLDNIPASPQSTRPLFTLYLSEPHLSALALPL